MLEFTLNPLSIIAPVAIAIFYKFMSVKKENE